LQNRPEVVGAARSDPGLQVPAHLRPHRQIPIINFHFQKVPPIANRALDGHLGTMFHNKFTVDSSQLTVKKPRAPLAASYFEGPLSTIHYSLFTIFQLFFLSSGSTTSASITSPSPLAWPWASP